MRTLLIVDLGQYYVCCTRSGVTRCDLFIGALPVPYVPVPVTLGAVIAHRYTYLDTWCGFEAGKTVPWPSRGLQHFGKFIEPSD